MSLWNRVVGGMLGSSREKSLSDNEEQQDLQRTWTTGTEGRGSIASLFGNISPCAKAKNSPSAPPSSALTPIGRSSLRGGHTTIAQLVDTGPSPFRQPLRRARSGLLTAAGTLRRKASWLHDSSMRSQTSLSSERSPKSRFSASIRSGYQTMKAYHPEEPELATHKENQGIQKSSPVDIPHLPPDKFILPAINQEPLGDIPLVATARPSPEGPNWGKINILQSPRKRKEKEYVQLVYNSLPTPMPGTNLPLDDPFLDLTKESDATNRLSITVTTASPTDINAAAVLSDAQEHLLVDSSPEDQNAKQVTMIPEIVQGILQEDVEDKIPSITRRPLLSRHPNLEEELSKFLSSKGRTISSEYDADSESIGESYHPRMGSYDSWKSRRADRQQRYHAVMDSTCDYEGYGYSEDSLQPLPTYSSIDIIRPQSRSISPNESVLSIGDVSMKPAVIDEAETFAVRLKKPKKAKISNDSKLRFIHFLEANSKSEEMKSIHLDNSEASSEGEEDTKNDKRIHIIVPEQKNSEMSNSTVEISTLRSSMTTDVEDVVKSEGSLGSRENEMEHHMSSH
ncbi:MAG: hypothetical protein M1834_006661 [Cirrosporium novae-zelandiae]|nr:MAG: hypothetical protein M1834_006661 [Cirrosporium novae-zelandiae]